MNGIYNVVNDLNSKGLSIYIVPDRTECKTVTRCDHFSASFMTNSSRMYLFL